MKTEVFKYISWFSRTAPSKIKPVCSNLSAVLNHKRSHSLQQEQQRRRHAKPIWALNSEDLLLNPFISQANSGLDKLPMPPSPHFCFHYSLHKLQDSLWSGQTPVCVHSTRMKVQMKILWFCDLTAVLFLSEVLHRPGMEKNSLRKLQGSFCFGFAKTQFVTSIPLAVLPWGLSVKRWFPAEGGLDRGSRLSCLLMVEARDRTKTHFSPALLFSHPLKFNLKMMSMGFYPC